MGEIKGYKKLKIWQKSHLLAMETYKATKLFPKEELYGVTSQLRRAVLSVPLNIVEGHASNSKKEFLHFLNISNRSLVETEYLLEITHELGYLTEEHFNQLESIKCQVGALLKAFVTSVANRL